MYWDKDRDKRKEYNGLTAEKDRKEKLDAWLKELEARAEEEEELQKLRSKITKGQAEERRRLTESKKKAAEARLSEVKCVAEPGDLRNDGPILSELRRLWQGRR